jgi:hypothetical protein
MVLGRRNAGHRNDHADNRICVRKRYNFTNDFERNQTEALNFELFRAAAAGDRKLVEGLLARGATVNAREEEGETH